MHRLVPDFIVENYRADRTHGNVKSVGMFLDLSGFSAMTDALMHHGQHGAEVLAGLMHAVFDPLVAGIFEYGGQVVGFAGDGITAIFPAESDQKLSAQRALASAWLIQRRMLSHPAQETEYGPFFFSAKIGLAFGDVEWGILESRAAEQATYYFRGSAIEDSAEAEHRAVAGQIILAPSMTGILGAGVQTEANDRFHRLVEVDFELPASSEVVLAPVDLQISRLFVPEEIVAQDVRGEFRQVVNVFMRFPELSADDLQKFIQIVFDLKQRYGGLLSRPDFGDKGSTLLVLWGAPLAYENDISRAINFVFDLQARVEFPITVGVTYYIAHAGYLGSTLYEDYTCYGWGVNLASRFMTTAHSGQVWIDDRVARRVVSYFDLEQISAQKFKGFATEQKVYLLRGRKTEVEPEYQGEMVGRDRELGSLAEFVLPLWQGKFAGSMVVWGDAGIGKGRLVFEFRSSELFNSHPALWALCQADQIVRSPFNPFRYWLIHYFGLTSRMNVEEKKQAFRARLGDLTQATSDPELVAELDRLWSVLAALIDLHWDDSFYELLDAQGRYDTTLLALIALLKAESLRQPVILFLEDAQFVDDDTRNFLPRLKRALTAETITYPVALIATSRHHGPALPYEEGLFDRKLELGGLTIEAISRLAEILLGDVTAPALSKWLMERSEGNPYFAEQIIHYLMDEKLIEMSKLGWALVKRWNESIVPADISAVLVARLDQLAHEVREVIQTASVLGREFEVLVLAQMLGDDHFLYDEIAEAEKAAIWSPLSQIRYLFTHGLIRDAAYSMQMQARRQELHTLALGALEKLFADEIQNHYDKLAYHSEQAMISDKAIHYLQRAGEAARDSYHNAQGVDYFTRALEFVPGADLNLQFYLHGEIEKLVTELGLRNNRIRELEVMQNIARQLGTDAALAHVDHRKLLFELKSGNYSEAVALAESAIRLYASAGDERLTVDARVAWSEASQRMGQYAAAIASLEGALEQARKIRYTSGEALILNALGLISIEMKDPVSAIDSYEKSLEIYRALGDLRGSAMLLNNLGNVAVNQGNFKHAFDCYEQSLRLAREIGSRKGEALLLGNLGWLSGLLGEYQKARLYSERQLVIARETGDRYSETMSLINLSGQVGAMGYNHTAVLFAEEALELTRTSRDRNMEAWALTYLGHSLLASGMVQAASEAYQSAVGIRIALDQPVLETEPLSGLARTYLGLNNPVAAMQSIEKILVLLASGRTLDGTDEPTRIYLNCYLVLEANRDERAKPLIIAAHDLLIARAANIPEPAARQSFLENIPHNREIISIWEKSGGP
jgi:predicted ATPase/class 3 adenylate cyclase